MADAAVNRGQGQKKIGLVVSKPGRKTIKVKVERLVTHPLYKRVVKRSKGFVAHDENEICALGDKVEIVECRPLSARKRWRLKRVITRAETGAPTTGEE